ncbi:MAG: hypothetical protein B7Y80_05010 [Hyphomicrobium sp. 32-62-53]|nr:MAG: hypothetical protein B7Z29_05265 [Hyphomicrobium sp. 12-62-95]OYY01255.1 MAG: hypothetical protein B7Y80_05010 [Hyphomicrobium sp. 32-62-53]
MSRKDVSKRRTKPEEPKSRQMARRELHAHLNNILDGPGDDHVDEWVTGTLAALGYFIRAAQPAIDYEIGRVVSGIERPCGTFALGREVYPLWKGASLDVDSTTAATWYKLGHTTRQPKSDSDPQSPSPERIARILSQILKPISRASYFGYLIDLSNDLDALWYGEQRPLLQPRRTRKRGYGVGKKARDIRLFAVAWVKFQSEAKLLTKSAASEIVCSKYGRADKKTVQDWEKELQREPIDPFVREELDFARGAGQRHREVIKLIESNVDLSASQKRIKDHIEQYFSDSRLNCAAEKFRKLPKK